MLAVYHRHNPMAGSRGPRGLNSVLPTSKLCRRLENQGARAKFLYSQQRKGWFWTSQINPVSQLKPDPGQPLGGYSGAHSTGAAEYLRRSLRQTWGRTHAASHQSTQTRHQGAQQGQRVTTCLFVPRTPLPFVLLFVNLVVWHVPLL